MGGELIVALSGSGSKSCDGLTVYPAQTEHHQGKGNDTDKNGNEIQTIPVKILDNVSAVSLGWYRGAAIKNDGSLWVWGESSFWEGVEPD